MSRWDDLLNWFTREEGQVERNVALICATTLVATRDLRAATYGHDDVLRIAKEYERYLLGELPHV